MPKNDTSDELMAALMKHRGRLDRWLRRFGIDDGERPDIIQRAAEKVWLSLRGTRCPNDVGGLLHTAVKNLAIDRHRELGTRMEALPLLSIDDAASPNPEDELHKQRLWMCVRQAIDSLPERSAEVLRMRFFDELSVQELARALDISLASAYRAVDTALEELERELGRRGIAGPLCIPMLDRALVERADAAPASDKRGVQAAWSAPAFALPSRQSRFWHDMSKFVIGAVVGGVLVYLFLSNHGTPPAVARIPRYEVTIVPAAHRDARTEPVAIPTMVCPETPAAQPPRPSGKNGGPGQPEPNAKPRLLAQICKKALDAHDCDTARRICPQVPGSFGALLAQQRPCTVAE